MTNQEFIEKVAGYVKKYAPEYGIKVHSPIIAQAVLESGWGKSRLAASFHNYFGMKCGTKWKGASVNMATQEEYTPGTLTNISDNFRAYSSMEEGIKGYFEFIQLDRYKNLVGITDPQQYLETIKADGYATSSTYVDNNMRVIRENSLTKYDPATTSSEDTLVSQQDLIMNKAISFIGVRENPPGSNNVQFNTDYYGGPVSGDWYPWCCAYVWDIFRMCNLSRLFYNGQKTAYCPTVYNWACQNDLIVPKTEGQWADIVLFDWGGDGVADHTGFIEKNLGGGTYSTVEGNTSDGNDSNGGIVMRRTRYASQIQAIIRPRYTTDKVLQTTLVSNEKWEPKGTGVSAVDNLYIRSLPSTSGVILGELMKGNRFEVDGTVSGNWTKVKVSNVGIGWLYTSYISLDGKPAVSTTISTKQDKTKRLFVGRVTADVLNVRTWAGEGYPRINSYPELKYGNLVDVMNFTQRDSQGAKWYYVKIKNKYFGFCHSDYIAKN